MRIDFEGFKIYSQKLVKKVLMVTFLSRERGPEKVVRIQAIYNFYTIYSDFFFSVFQTFFRSRESFTSGVI